MGKPLPPIMGDSKKSATLSSSPAPAKVNSTASQSASKDIPKWIMPLGIAYLVIRGLTIIAKIYIGFWDWIIILGLAVVAIINLLSGKQKSISLITIIAIGCILWGNDHNIKSTTSEQSAGQQEQVAPAPVEEDIDKGAILPRTNNPIYLTKSGQYVVKQGKYRLCFSWLGDEEDGGSRINQSLKINDFEFNSTGSNCYQYTSEGKIYVEFINPTQSTTDTYLHYKKRVGGQGIYPFLEPLK